MSETEPSLDVLDACVLIPASLRDVLLRAAAARLYQPYWSEEILEEVRRNLVRREMTSPERAERLLETIRRAFPQAMISDYVHLIGEIDISSSDRHVLAAAIKAEADSIVTFNLRHFPSAALSGSNITVKHPDVFLSELASRVPLTMARIVVLQAADLRNPPVSIDNLLARLSIHVPTFVQLVSSVFEQWSR